MRFYICMLTDAADKGLHFIFGLVYTFYCEKYSANICETTERSGRHCGTQKLRNTNYCVAATLSVCLKKIYCFSCFLNLPKLSIFKKDWHISNE